MLRKSRRVFLPRTLGSLQLHTTDIQPIINAAIAPRLMTLFVSTVEVINS